jgi:hypothetical protein
MAPATFNSLPLEIRLSIFELALAADWKPRTVEVFIKSGEIYSRTPPPPLLHVNSESRYVTLRCYKPWLSAHKDLLMEKPRPNNWTPALTYTPWEEIIEKHGLEKASGLQNVCIDLEYDTLLMTGHKFPYPLGPLDTERVLSVAFKSKGFYLGSDFKSALREFPFGDITGMPFQINSVKHEDQMRKFHNLHRLTIYKRGRSFEDICACFEHRWRELEPPIAGSEELREHAVGVRFCPMEDIPVPNRSKDCGLTYKHPPYGVYAGHDHPVRRSRRIADRMDNSA